jgi:hypothetical protein
VQPSPFNQPIYGKPQHIRGIALTLQEFTMCLDPAMEEAPKKRYAAYKISKNIEVNKKPQSILGSRLRLN